MRFEGPDVRQSWMGLGGVGWGTGGVGGSCGMGGLGLDASDTARYNASGWAGPDATPRPRGAGVGRGVTL